MHLWACEAAAVCSPSRAARQRIQVERQAACPAPVGLPPQAALRPVPVTGKRCQGPCGTPSCRSHRNPLRAEVRQDVAAEHPPVIGQVERLVRREHATNIAQRIRPWSSLRCANRCAQPRQPARGPRSQGPLAAGSIRCRTGAMECPDGSGVGSARRVGAAQDGGDAVNMLQRNRLRMLLAGRLCPPIRRDETATGPATARRRFPSDNRRRA